MIKAERSSHSNPRREICLTCKKAEQKTRENIFILRSSSGHQSEFLCLSLFHFLQKEEGKREEREEIERGERERRERDKERGERKRERERERKERVRPQSLICDCSFPHRVWPKAHL